MTNWPTKKLGELVDFLDNQRKPINDEDRQKRVGPYPYYGANGQVGWIDDFIFDEELVLLAEDGGYFGSKDRPIAYRISGKTWVNNHAHVLRVKRDIAETGFIHYRLMFYDIKPYITGSTRTKLNKSAAEKIKIPLPPLAIQKQIVERLDKIAEAQKLNDGLIQKTDELFQSLLHKELNPADKDWSTKRLKEICEINPSKAKINKLSANTSVSFLAMADVSESAEITNRQEKKISEVKNGFTFFEDGDVLVAKITPCFENGKGALIENMKNGIGFGSTEFHVLRSNSKILLNQFLYYLVSDKKFRKIGAKFMIGSAGQRRVPKQYLENHKITLPPLETQKKIVAKLSAVQDYKKQLLEQKSKLKELFDSSLAKSMSTK